MPKKKTATTQSFAKDFAKLEKLVERFEEEDIDLDQSLKDFEEGLKIAERLKKSLDSVENKIETLKSKYDSDGD